MCRIQGRLKSSTSYSPPTRCSIEFLHSPADGESLLTGGSLMSDSWSRFLFLCSFSISLACTASTLRGWSSSFGQHNRTSWQSFTPSCRYFAFVSCSNRCGRTASRLMSRPLPRRVEGKSDIVQNAHARAWFVRIRFARLRGPTYVKLSSIKGCAVTCFFRVCVSIIRFRF